MIPDSSGAQQAYLRFFKSMEKVGFQIAPLFA